MKRILDYEEMIAFLENLDHNIIQKQDPIGETSFGEPILHYTYGSGDKHIILTAGIHSAELITNMFLLNVMKDLSDRRIKIDSKRYTIHFIPIENPDGTIIVTSAIRTLIAKDMPEYMEQAICLQYYLNSRMDDQFVIEHKNKKDKLIHTMFQYATSECIDEKYALLSANVNKIIKQNNLLKGSLINWSSNGNGVDLNANIECGKHFEKFVSQEQDYASLRLNQIDRLKLGPIGCPSRDRKFVLELENKAVLEFYLELIKKHQVIGSILYHSCGGYIYYLDFMKEKNPWNYNYGIAEIEYNRKVASAYSRYTNYKLGTPNTYTTFCSKLRTYLPGTLVVELSKLRSTPLSQFINLDLSSNEFEKEIKGEMRHLSKNYDHTYQQNVQALLKTISVMEDEYDKYRYHILVNRQTLCRENLHFEMVDTNSLYEEHQTVEKETFRNWIKFQKDAFKKGYKIEIESAYRNPECQKKVYKEIEKRNGKEYASKYVAPSGYSEHQTGLAIDICLKTENGYLCDQKLIGNNVLKFIEDNCYRYGFILRYPKNKEKITGYCYEPWHIRYVGKTLAKTLTEQKITLEEYYLEKS